jgi:hypothetical protein
MLACPAREILACRHAGCCLPAREILACRHAGCCLPARRMLACPARRMLACPPCRIPVCHVRSWPAATRNRPHAIVLGWHRPGLLG